MRLAFVDTAAIDRIVSEREGRPIFCKSIERDSEGTQLYIYYYAENDVFKGAILDSDGSFRFLDLPWGSFILGDQGRLVAWFDKSNKKLYFQSGKNLAACRS
jgi:hypothetical protein